MELVKLVILFLIVIVVFLVPLIVFLTTAKWMFGALRDYGTLDVFHSDKVLRGENWPIFVVSISFVFVFVINFWGLNLFPWRGQGIDLEISLIKGSSQCGAEMHAVERINIWRNGLIIALLEIFLICSRLKYWVRDLSFKMIKYHKINMNLGAPIILIAGSSFFVLKTINLFNPIQFCSEDYSKFSDLFYFSFASVSSAFLFCYFLVLVIVLVKHFRKNTR